VFSHAAEPFANDHGILRFQLSGQAAIPT